MVKAYYITSTVTLDIEPCPFCGSNEVNVITMDGMSRARCEGCSAVGPRSKVAVPRDGDAIIAWNKRIETCS